MRNVDVGIGMPGRPKNIVAFTWDAAGEQLRKAAEAFLKELDLSHQLLPSAVLDRKRAFEKALAEVK